MFIQALFCGLIAAYGTFDFALGSLYLNRPIFLSSMVGLVLGDFQAGIIIGATLELFFMGAISVGAYIPPDAVVGSVLATALAIMNGYTTEVALTFAMPIALLSLTLGNLIVLIQPFFLKLADKYALQGNSKKVISMQWVMGFINTFRRFILAFIGVYFGASVVEGIISSIPEFVTVGMEAAAGLLPAMGFAMLMRMILTKQILPYYFLGFALAAYLKVPSLGVAIFGTVLVFVKFGFLEPKTNYISEGTMDDDF